MTTESYARVTRALRRSIGSAPGAVRVIADVDSLHHISPALSLAELLDAQALGIVGVAGYASAERIVSGLEMRHAPDGVRLVLLCGDAWTRCLLSAVGIRPWPVPFEMLRGLSPSERADFFRRACTIARKGNAVCGIKPWRAANVDAAKR